MNRFFIVCYNSEGSAGQIGYKIKDEKYVNRQEIKDDLEYNHGIDDVIITNIIEVSGLDYAEFSR